MLTDRQQDRERRLISQQRQARREAIKQNRAEQRAHLERLTEQELVARLTAMRGERRIIRQVLKDRKKGA